MKEIVVSLLFILLTSIFAFAQTPTKTTKKAAEAISRGDIQGAIQILDDAIVKRIDLLEAYKMRSHLRMFSKNLKGAINDLTEAIRIKNDDPELYARRAEIKVFLQDESALDDFSFAIAGGYKTEKVYIGRATFKRNQGKLDEAISDYRTAVGLNPNSIQAVVGLSSVLEQKGETDEAISLLKDILRQIEVSSDGKIAKIELDTKGKTSVIEDYESGYGSEQVLITESPVSTGNSTSELENSLNISMTYANLARLQSDKGFLDEAFENIQKSLVINKSDGYTLGIRGVIYLKKREYEKALNDFDKSIEIMSYLPNYYLDRGITYLLMGKPVKAQEDFDTYLKKNPIGKNYMNKRIEEAKLMISTNN